MNKIRILEAERKYKELKYKLENKIISTDEFKREHKILLIKDSMGIFWIIGDKSGKWYKNVAGKWLSDNPYNYIKEEIKQEKIFVEDIKESRIDKLDKNSFFKEKDEIKESIEEKKELLIKSVGVLSLAFVSFGLFFFIGLLWGAAVGIFSDAYYPFISYLPNFIVRYRSTITGGFIFSLLNAILFSFLGYLFGLFLGYFFNFFAYLVGGVRFRILSKSE